MRFKNLDELRKTKVGALPINQPLYALDPSQDHKRERHPLSTLVEIQKNEFRRQTSVGFCVTIVSFRHFEVDDDNLGAGAKSLRDAIAASLGVDDRDKRLWWEIRQVLTRGAEGSLVEISTFELVNKHGQAVPQRVKAATRPR